WLQFPSTSSFFPNSAKFSDDYNSAVTPNETVDSLIIGDKHLDTIPATESDEFIKSSVENLVPNPSESEGENGCDLPACFTTFSNILFDAEYEFDSVDNQPLHNEDFSEEIFSNPLFEEKINSMRIDQRHFNAESDLVESMQVLRYTGLRDTDVGCCEVEGVGWRSEGMAEPSPSAIKNLQILEQMELQGIANMYIDLSEVGFKGCDTGLDYSKRWKTREQCLGSLGGNFVFRVYKFKFRELTSLALQGQPNKIFMPLALVFRALSKSVPDFDWFDFDFGFDLIDFFMLSITCLILSGFDFDFVFFFDIRYLHKKNAKHTNTMYFGYVFGHLCPVLKVKGMCI
nr:hypothetical protein [Tanacetum cinerariifolium]